METQCVYCEIWTQYVCIIYRNLMLQRYSFRLPLRCLKKTNTCCVLLQPLASVLTELRQEVIVRQSPSGQTLSQGVRPQLYWFYLRLQTPRSDIPQQHRTGPACRCAYGKRRGIVAVRGSIIQNRKSCKFVSLTSSFKLLFHALKNMKMLLCLMISDTRDSNALYGPRHRRNLGGSMTPPTFLCIK